MTLSSDTRASELLAAHRRVCRPDGAITKSMLDGCDAYVLSDEHASITVVPSRGARITSMLHKPTSYEWMWRPSRSIELPECEPGSSFENSPITGADECIPTVGACEVEGVQYPDHGEAWARAWDVSVDDEACVIETSLRLTCVPLVVSRLVSIEDGSFVLDYSVTNKGHESVPWLWSWHPLLRLPASARLVMNGFAETMRYDNGDGVRQDPTWVWPRPFDRTDLSRAELGGPKRSVKLFADRINRDSSVSLSDDIAGESIRVDLLGEALRGLGLWINRGGWNGYQHIAIEPTTTPHERPTDLRSNKTAVMIEPGEIVPFALRISLGRSD